MEALLGVFNPTILGPSLWLWKLRRWFVYSSIYLYCDWAGLGSIAWWPAGPLYCELEQDTIFLCLATARTITTGTSKTGIQRSKDIIQSRLVRGTELGWQKIINCWNEVDDICCLLGSQETWSSSWQHNSRWHKAHDTWHITPDMCAQVARCWYLHTRVGTLLIRDESVTCQKLKCKNNQSL